MGRISQVGAYTTSTEGKPTKLYEGPYKLVAIHFGTRKSHWHLIYYSCNKQWGINSRLGRIIRSGTYKNKSVDCLSCLREYLYSGNGRQILQDILDKKHIKSCECAEHQCGMVGENKWKTSNYSIDCTEGGDTIFRSQGMSSEEKYDGMVDAIIQADDDQDGEIGHEIPGKTRKILDGQQNGEQFNSIARYDSENNSRNSNIIMALCKGGAFTEAEAMELFAKSTEGIEFVCTKFYVEKIRTHIQLARILVFSESIKQRFERAKAKYERDYPDLMHEETQDEIKQKLKEILRNNKINEKTFMIILQRLITILQVNVQKCHILV